MKTAVEASPTSHSVATTEREPAARKAPVWVASACRTALGPGEDGQALASLTGAFLAAGSRSVVATLWDVGDASTAVFMQQFYWELGQSRTPAEALRAAKRHLRADPRWSRPDLWAGYVLVGNAPAVVPRKIPWVLWGALIVAAVLGAMALGKAILAKLAVWM
jgi:CHAT domain-containing protein